MDWNIHRDIGGSDSTTSSQPALAKVVERAQPRRVDDQRTRRQQRLLQRDRGAHYLVGFIQNSLTIFGTSPQENVNFFIYQSAQNDGYDTVAIVSRYRFLSTQTFNDSGGGFSALRGLAMAVVDVPGATDVGVFTTHLKALNTVTDAERRQAAAVVDQASIATWMAANPNTGTIVTGDWNESEDAGDATNWTGHSIGDPLPNNGAAYHPITTLRGSLMDARPLSAAGAPDTISSSNPSARFDYLDFSPVKLSLSSGLVFDTKQFTSPQLAVFNAANGTSFVAGDSASASDHLPVFGVFQVVPEPSSLALVFAGLGPWFGRRRRR